MQRLGICVSGGGTNLQAIMDAIDNKLIRDTEIALVISNKENAFALARARKAGIPAQCISPKAYATREAFGEAMVAILREYKVDLVVLAGYIVIIPKILVKNYPDKIINIHHSFLPAFVGAKPYHAAFQRGVKIIGATSHYVTTELDAGPIIEQDVVRITHKDAIEDLVNKGKDLEKIVLSRAVQKHIERKVLAYKNKTVIFS